MVILQKKKHLHSPTKANMGHIKILQKLCQKIILMFSILPSSVSHLILAKNIDAYFDWNRILLHLLIYGYLLYVKQHNITRNTPRKGGSNKICSWNRIIHS